MAGDCRELMSHAQHLPVWQGQLRYAVPASLAGCSSADGPAGQSTHLLDYRPRQDVRGHFAFEPLPIPGTPEQSTMVDDDFATQDRHYGISLATETVPDTVVGIGVEIVQSQGLV